MKQNVGRIINQWKKVKYALNIALSFMICYAVSGCSVNRISLMSSSGDGIPIQESEVKIYDNFKEINEPWWLEGMMSNWHAPLMNNTPENREKDLKKAAAKLGANALVGLINNVGEFIYEEGGGGASLTQGILAKVGPNQQNNETIPKFIVCLPPVNYNIEKTSDTSKLDDYLLDYIQYLLGYGKGYYAYRSNAKDINAMSILNGSVNAAILNEPLGIAPHYALLCDVNGFDHKGNSVIAEWQTLNITLILYDLEEKKAVWTNSAEGESSKRGILLGQYLFDIMYMKKQDLHAVQKTVNKALEKLPAVKGFQKGGGDFPI